MITILLCIIGLLFIWGSITTILLIVTFKDNKKLEIKLDSELLKLEKQMHIVGQTLRTKYVKSKRKRKQNYMA